MTGGLGANLCRPLCSRDVWNLRFSPWLSGAKCGGRAVHRCLRLHCTGRLSFHSCLKNTLMCPLALRDLCSSWPPLERGRAVSLLRGHPSSHGSGRGRLVDGPKERQHRTGSRLLPCQGITAIWLKSSLVSNEHRRANYCKGVFLDLFDATCICVEITLIGGKWNVQAPSSK